jgi:hypothetical protein
VGIEVAVLMDEEESAAAQKSRLLVFLQEEILEVKFHAHLRKEVHARIREIISARNSVLRRRTMLNREVRQSPPCEELPSLATAAGIPGVRWQN